MTRRLRFDDFAFEVKDVVAVPAQSGHERYVGLEHLDQGSLRIRRWGSTADVEKPKLLFRAGDVIFGRRNAYLRRVAVADFDGVCSAHAMVLRPRVELLADGFLQHLMQSNGFWTAALRNSAGSLSPTINWPNLAAEEFDVPSRDQQELIVRRLAASEDAVESLRELSERLRALRLALINDVVDEASREGRLMQPLCELVEDERGGASLAPEDFATEGQAVLHKGDIGHSGWVSLDPQRNRYCTQGAANEHCRKLIDGSFLVMTTRDLVPSGPNIGLVCRIKSSTPLLPAQGVWAFRPRDHVRPSYMSALSVSSWYRRRILSLAVGSTQIHVRTSELARLRVPVAPPQTQAELADALTEMDGGLEATEARLLAAQDLHTGLRESLLSVDGGRR